MNLLGIDASTELISFCFMINGKIVFDFYRRKKHGTSRIVFYLKSALDKLALKPRAFSAFVIGAGPGSFTGLRISFSIIKALSLALNKPVINIGSFFALANQLKGRFPKIATIADAKRGFIYATTFRVKNSKVIREKKEKLYILKDFLCKHKDYAFVTYDEALRKKALAMEGGIDFYYQPVWPKAKELLILAQDYYKNREFTPIDKLEPIYVYPKDCQVRKISS